MDSLPPLVLLGAHAERHRAELFDAELHGVADRERLDDDAAA